MLYPRLLLQVEQKLDQPKGSADPKAEPYAVGARTY